MKKANAIRYYRKFSAAEGYIIGFCYKKEWYMITLDEIPPRYMTVERECSAKGGHEKLQLRLRNAYKEQLIRKGAVKIDFIPEGNKGRAFERFVYEQNGQEFRGNDHVGFWVEGDINIDGIEYQLKLEGAQIVTFATLHNLQKAGKDFRNYVPKVGRKPKAA
jgi:hypothetical protein